MTRWALASVVSLVLAGALGVAIARGLGWSGSRLSVLVSVICAWLGAYAVWSVAAGVAAHLGWLARYDGDLFALLAILGGVVHYRAHVGGGRERGLAIFVGGQLTWLVIVLARNGVFAN